MNKEILQPATPEQIEEEFQAMLRDMGITEPHARVLLANNHDQIEMSAWEKWRNEKQTN